MSKKGKRYFADAKPKPSKSLYAGDEDDEKVDPKSSKYYYDDVDEFHSNKEKVC